MITPIKTFFSGFLSALSFLTRISIVQPAKKAGLESLWPFFPSVGALLGILLALPFSLGLFAGHSWVQAWVYVGLLLLITGGLHWDGWADIWDACSFAHDPERFRTILKDSRSGAFGMLGLIMGVFGLIFLVRTAMLEQHFHILVWSLILGRSAASIPAYLFRDATRPGLAQSMISGLKLQHILLIWRQALLFGVLILSPAALITSLLLLIPGIMELCLLARRTGGISGDFLGASIIWGGLAGLLGWSLSFSAGL
jgi:adenosylcobinamide-GDP ribazoletransferase